MQGSEDRALGAFWGLAVGDAMGAPVEFLTPGTFPKVTGYQPSPRFGLDPGAWTDDTIMAVCMAESIIAEGGYDSFAVMQDYVDWMVRGHNSPNGTCFDIGIQTARALRQFRAIPAIAESTESAGNGTIMRLAPAVIASHDSPPDEAARLFEISARDTHNSDLAAEATVLFGMILRNLMEGTSFRESLVLAAETTERHLKERGLPSQLVAETVYAFDDEAANNSGFVIPSLGTAIWAVRSTDTFEDAVLTAVNLGDDADTVAAITGQMAGALYGAGAIPEEWVADLHRRDDLVEMTAGLLGGKGIVLRTRSY